MRELMRALSSLESDLERRHGITLNEAMVMCCIGSGSATATSISENIGLTPSNTSKLLRSMEGKGLLKRAMGEKDRRCMYFTLTQEGLNRLGVLKSDEIPVPDTIAPLFSLPLHEGDLTRDISMT